MMPSPDTRNADVEGLYDRVAPVWARDAAKVHDDLIGRPIILELIDRYGRDKRVIDCGCGDGYVCRLISDIVHRVTGVDSSKGMLSEATRRSAGYSNVDFVRARIETLGSVVRHESVDLCLALFALCCMRSVHDLERAFRELTLVLKPDGRAIVQIPHPTDGLFREESAWFEDKPEMRSYFDRGVLVQRRLRTLDGGWIDAARYHHTVGDYINAMLKAGLGLEAVVEPQASSEVLERYPSLARESRLPSTIIFVARKL